jgi:hypothetical protein
MGLTKMVLCLFAGLLFSCARNNTMARIDNVSFAGDTSQAEIKPAWLPTASKNIGLSVYMIAYDQEKLKTNMPWLIEKENHAQLLHGWDIEISIEWDKGGTSEYHSNGRRGFLRSDGIIVAVIPVECSMVGPGSISVRILKYDKELQEKLGPVYMTLEYPSGK